jgi:hypothetical protein
MMEEVGAHPHNLANSSPVSHGDLIYVSTSNGQDESHVNVPSPRAPSIIALNKKTGKLAWEANSVGEKILHGQWSSPAVAKVGDTVQVVMGEGDGWVRSYEAVSGKKLWEFDLNPKDSVWPKTRNEVISTPIIIDNVVYLANGQDPEHGEGVGHLYAIDATKRGDITKEGQIWHYDKIRRSISTARTRTESFTTPISAASCTRSTPRPASRSGRTTCSLLSGPRRPSLMTRCTWATKTAMWSSSSTARRRSRSPRSTWEARFTAPSSPPITR